MNCFVGGLSKDFESVTILRIELHAMELPIADGHRAASPLKKGLKNFIHASVFVLVPIGLLLI